MNPKKEFPRLLSYFEFEAFYDVNKLNLIFPLSNGNGCDTETVPCEEYFPEVSLANCNTKEQLVSAVLIQNDKNINVKNKIEDVHRELQVYCNCTNTFDDLDENELKQRAHDLQEENETLEVVLDDLKEQLDKVRRNM